MLGFDGEKRSETVIPVPLALCFRAAAALVGDLDRLVDIRVGERS
ncbi:MAG: hypothetical protein ACLUE4_09855 [Acutalibacteraceae bacterium]